MAGGSLLPEPDRGGLYEQPQFNSNRRKSGQRPYSSINNQRDASVYAETCVESLLQTGQSVPRFREGSIFL